MTDTLPFLLYKDGLGYYDDGEERLGDEAEGDNRSKKRAGSTANITAAALKRARKTKAMLADKKKKQVGEDVSKNHSMRDFVQRGASTSGASASTAGRGNAVASKNMPDLDSLVDGLDDVVPKKSSSSRRRPAHSYGSAGRQAASRRGRRASTTHSSSSRLYTRERNVQDEDDYAPGFHDDNDDDAASWDDEDAAMDTQPMEPKEAESSTLIVCQGLLCRNYCCERICG